MVRNVKFVFCLSLWSFTDDLSLLSKSTMIVIFKTDVIMVSLYGWESRRMTSRNEAKLDTFLHKCTPLKIYWLKRMLKEEVLKRTNMETISEQVRKSRRSWIGRVLRMNNSAIPRSSCTNEGTRRKTQQRNIQGNMAHDSGERTNGNGLLLLGRGRAYGG